MPVNASIALGMRHSGFTSELHCSTSSPRSTRTMPISVIRCQAALPPVVSKSTNTKSRGRAQSSAASIERQNRVIEVGTPIAIDAPRLAVAAHLVEIETRRQYGFADAIGLGDFLSRGRCDERRAVEAHRDRKSVV